MVSSEAEITSTPAMAFAISELNKSLQSAATLVTMLPDSPKTKLEEIMSSISKAISVLEQMDDNMDSPSSDFTSKRKMQGTSKTASRKRGKANSWRRVISSTMEDGYTWRKYGQKDIFSAKHPRCYFRCSYKHDRGCNARRQVQKSEDDPFLYEITYFEDHTCDLSKQNIMSCTEPHVISFESNEVNDINQGIPFSSFLSHKKENVEEAVSNLTSNDSPSNCFESSEIEVQKPPMIGLETGLNYSMTNYDLDFMNLEDILRYDQDGFFDMVG